MTGWSLPHRATLCCAFIIRQAKRTDYLRQACERILRHRSADTPCGYVRNIGRVKASRQRC